MPQIRRKREKKMVIPTDYDQKFDIDTFNNRLIELLEDKQMSKASLSETVNISQSTIQRWKTKTAQYKHIETLAEFFHVDAEYLYNPEHTEKDYFGKLHDLELQQFDQYIKETYQKHGTLIEYLKSIGCKVTTDFQNKCLMIHFENINFYFSDVTAKKIEHIIKYILLSEETIY